jgi:uncharacterized protein (DUF362 family)
MQEETKIFTSDNEVFISNVDVYNESVIYNNIPKHLFRIIEPGNTVVIKPNWIRESHLTKSEEWEYIITHPTLISAVLTVVLEFLNGSGKIIIADGPETASNFKKILEHYPIQDWSTACKNEKVELIIIDLREDQWIVDNNVIIERQKLSGDPKGSTQVNLKEDMSEFYNKMKSSKGYFGADSDIHETNFAHNGSDNLYRVSKSIIEADVFINLAKLKTHKKAGITACLKNLVGINTYKNYLPHCSLGTRTENGDQFSENSHKTSIEATFMPIIHQHVLRFPKLAVIFSPFISLGKKIFGSNQKTIRGGGWHGNDTLWRTILDLNKILLYANPDGSMRLPRSNSKKKYIGIVDAIIAGQGDGPKSPDPIKMNFIISGINPVAIDTVCATLMGFNPDKIPMIKNAFNIKHFPIVDFLPHYITINYSNNKFPLSNIPLSMIIPLTPNIGWKGYIEK